MNPAQALDRRDFFHWGINGLGATALASLLASETATATDTFGSHPAKAKRAIHICLVGGLSHIDSFDYKPELTRLHGKSLQTDEKPDLFFGKMGLLRGEDWKFQPRGEGGLMISDMFPNIAKLADDLTVLRSMESKSANHTPALFMANSGFEFNGFPSMGSWISYGMGVENESLPAYVVLNDERGARTPELPHGAVHFCRRIIRESCCVAANNRCAICFPVASSAQKPTRRRFSLCRP